MNNAMENKDATVYACAIIWVDFLLRLVEGAKQIVLIIFEPLLNNVSVLEMVVILLHVYVTISKDSILILMTSLLVIASHAVEME